MVVIGGVLLVAINAALIGIFMRFRSDRGKEPRRLKVKRPAQIAAASAFGVIALVVFVLGVIVTDDAKQVEASGPDGLQASSQTLVQRSLEIPAANTEPLEIRACGQQWIWRYQYPDGTYSYYELVV